MVMDMRSMIIMTILLFSTGVLLQNTIDVFSQSYSNENKTANPSFDTIVTNSLNLSSPVYQAYSGIFLGSKNLTSSPHVISEDKVIEKAIMKNVGNVTNNMTFLNTHLSDGTIQSAARGVITSEGGQNVGWISSDIGMINEKNEMFHGIIQFNSTNSSSFSFLNNATGIDKQTPEIKRTIWLIEK